MPKKYTKAVVEEAIILLEGLANANQAEAFCLRYEADTIAAGDLSVLAWCGVRGFDLVTEALEAAALLREGLIPEPASVCDVVWS